MLCQRKPLLLKRLKRLFQRKSPLRLLVRTASNSYFAMVLSALSVPDPDNVVRDALSSDTERLRTRQESSEDDLRVLLKFFII